MIGNSIMKELGLMSYISFRNFSHQILKCFGMRLSFDIKTQIFISKFKVSFMGHSEAAAQRCS